MKNLQTSSAILLGNDSIISLKPLSYLRNISSTNIQHLKSIKIATIGDLLTYAPIIKSRIINAISLDDSSQKEINLADLVDQSIADLISSDIIKQSIINIKGITEAEVEVFEKYFSITTIQELSCFPPFDEAISLFLENDQFKEPPSAPIDLLPKVLDNVASTVRFNTFVLGKKFRYTDYKIQMRYDPSPCSVSKNLLWNGSSLEVEDIINSFFGEEGLEAASSVLDQIAFEKISPSTKNDPSNLLSKIFTENCIIHFGYNLVHEQKWVNKGTHLGEIIHSLALAPGESRNISIIDWYRRQSSTRTENSTSQERLSDDIIHSRALSEVTEATAREHLAGTTDSSGSSKSLGLGLTGAVAATGKKVIGSIAGSFGFGKSKQKGSIKVETDSEREIMASVQQNITDTTKQNASRIRSLWGTVIVTDNQMESEFTQTRNITNYNHSHALTVQYYEVLQKYFVHNKIKSTTPLLYLPFKAIDFDFETINAFWNILNTAVREHDKNKYYKLKRIVQGSRNFNPDFNHNDSSITIDSIKFYGKYRLNRSLKNLNNGWYESLFDNTIVFELTDSKGEVVISLETLVNNSGNFTKETELFYTDSPTIDISNVSSLSIRLSSPLKDLESWGFAIYDEISISLQIELVDSKNEKKIFEIEEFFHKNNTIGSTDGSRFVIIPSIGRRISGMLHDMEVDPELEYPYESIKFVEDYFRQKKYLYTREILTALDEVELKQIINGLYFGHQVVSAGPIQGSDPRRFKYTFNPDFYLSDIVDPMPVIIEENYVALRLKKLDFSSFDVKTSRGWIMPKLFDELTKKVEENIPESISDEVYLPTAGVFCEAILGRSNSSEYVDPRRFWNWQDSPIPNAAPQILPISVNSRNDGPPGDLNLNIPDSTISQTEPARFPEQGGLAAILQAIQNGNMFRDMSKASELISTLNSLSQVANNAAISAGKLSKEAAESALNGAVALGNKVADMTNQVGGSPPSNLTEKAAALNELDNSKNSPGKLGDLDPYLNAVGLSSRNNTVPPSDEHVRAEVERDTHAYESIDKAEQVGALSPEEAKSEKKKVAKRAVARTTGTKTKNLIINFKDYSNGPLKGDFIVKVQDLSNGNYFKEHRVRDNFHFRMNIPQELKDIELEIYATHLYLPNWNNASKFAQFFAGEPSISKTKKALSNSLWGAEYFNISGDATQAFTCRLPLKEEITISFGAGSGSQAELLNNFKTKLTAGIPNIGNLTLEGTSFLPDISFSNALDFDLKTKIVILDNHLEISS